jgi:hypothetical protein
MLNVLGVDQILLAQGHPLPQNIEVKTFVSLNLCIVASWKYIIELMCIGHLGAIPTKLSCGCRA